MKNVFWRKVVEAYAKTPAAPALARNSHFPNWKIYVHASDYKAQGAKAKAGPAPKQTSKWRETEPENNDLLTASEHVQAVVERKRHGGASCHNQGKRCVLASVPIVFANTITGSSRYSTKMAQTKALFKTRKHCGY